jgi:triphosphoribosyl-dephospho-CoA synthase
VLSAAYIASAAQLACLLEAAAPKPGNVSPGRHFADATYHAFLASAAAIGPALEAAGAQAVGVTIRQAVAATSEWARSNTNLGMVLLMAPLARAASIASGVGSPEEQGDHAVTPVTLRAALRQALDATTIDDARDVYAAIRMAMPGGLGRVDAQDVSDEPTVTLVDAMRLASQRDGIAREYVTGFEVTFERAVPWLERARAEGLSWDDAVVETFLRLLAADLDTHIARRAGRRAAEEVSRLAAAAIEAGGVRTETGRRTIDEMDRALRGSNNASNPGMTADVTAAAIFVVLLTGGWSPGGTHAATR